MLSLFGSVSARTCRFVSASCFAPAPSVIQRLSSRQLATKETSTHLINGQINFPSLRVVYTDPTSNAKTWKIMSRADALRLALDLSSDLILGETSLPIVLHSN